MLSFFGKADRHEGIAFECHSSDSYSKTVFRVLLDAHFIKNLSLYCKIFIISLYICNMFPE